MKFVVTITETLEKEVIVEADNPIEAEEIVHKDWANEKHVLDSSNFTGVSFYADCHTYDDMR